jgi:hypothetical protein
MKFKVFSYADVNTSHIKPSDAALLDHENRDWGLNFVVIARYPEGYFLAIGNKFSDNDVCEVISSGFSEEFASLLREMHKQDIVYLRIDADGCVVEGAPTLQWLQSGGTYGVGS